MQFSLVQTQNGDEIERVRDYVELSLQLDNDPQPIFKTINSIDVPVNQEIAWEFTRFKAKKRVYKNPNLSQIHAKSSIEVQPQKKGVERRSRPGKHQLKHGVGSLRRRLIPSVCLVFYGWWGLIVSF